MRGRHGGYAAQAQRRGEQYVGCNTCGQPRHPRRQAEPHTEESFLAQLGVAFLLMASLYALLIVAAGATA